MLVTVKSVGGTPKKINVEEARTWGQLKQVLTQNNVSTNNMKALVGGSNVSLELDEANIPTEDFILFLLPVKVKSGAGYTKAFLESVQKQINSKKGAAVSAAKLNISVQEYNAAKEYVKKNGIKPTSKATTVKEVKTVSKPTQVVTAVTVDAFEVLIQPIEEALKVSPNSPAMNLILNKLSSVTAKVGVESAEAKALREQKQREKEENDALEAEAERLAAKFR